MTSLNSKKYGSLQLAREHESDITALTAGAATIEIEVNPNYRHWFLGVEFFSDADGTPSTPTGGTYTFTVETLAIRNVEQSPTGGAVDIAVDGNVEVNVSGNAGVVKVVLDSIAGGSTTHCRLRAIGNIS